MNEPKPFASLSPGLLARKGGARPAMRPQLQPLSQFHEATARQIDDDLGWNDMGHDHGDSPDQEFAQHSGHLHDVVQGMTPMASFEASQDEQFDDVEDEPVREAEVVELNPTAPAPMAELVASKPKVPEVPEVVRQQDAIAARVAAAPRAGRQRRSALNDGRRAAFTLRLDAERHLKLRLACTLNNRSAQQLVTDALDRLISELPDVATLAAQVRQRG